VTCSVEQFKRGKDSVSAGASVSASESQDLLRMSRTSAVLTANTKDARHAQKLWIALDATGTDTCTGTRCHALIPP